MTDFGACGAKSVNDVACMVPGVTITSKPVLTACVAFVFLDRFADVDEYQAHSITLIWVLEVGQYLPSEPIDYLFAVLRPAKGVPTQMNLTANPVGAGQH